MIIPDFNLNDLKINDKVYLISFRDSKSKFQLINEILKIKDVSNGLLISNDLEMDYVFTLLKEFSNINLKMTNFQYSQKLIEEYLLYKNTMPECYNYLILDDCFYDRSWCKDKNIYNIFTNKYSSYLTILSSQYPLYMIKDFHMNIDCIIISRTNIQKDLQLIYSYFGSKVYNTYEEFENMANVIFSQYYKLVIYDGKIYKLKNEKNE